MGNFFGAWQVTMPDGVKHVIVCKAYALAQCVAEDRFPGHEKLDLVSTKYGLGGQVVVVEDDGTERVG